MSKTNCVGSNCFSSVVSSSDFVYVIGILIVTTLKERKKGEMIVVTYFRALHRWIVKAHTDHKVFQILRYTMQWKDTVSWLWTKAAATIENAGDWRHGICGQRVTKWDTWLVKMYGLGWAEVIGSKIWQSAESLFVLNAIQSIFCR